MIDSVETLVERGIDKVKRKVYGKTFRCPVCHLELSYYDVDKDGLVVCPLCGIVIEVVDVFGHALPVVHDVEIKRYQPKLRLHPLSVHLPLGLFPFSLLISLLLLCGSIIIPQFQSHIFVQNIYRYTAMLNHISAFLHFASLVGTIPAFLSGLYDWYFRYEKRRYRTVDVKILASLGFFVFGLIAFLLHNGGFVFSFESGLVEPTFPNIFYAMCYLFLMFLNLIFLIIVGHLGGLLVFGK